MAACRSQRARWTGSALWASLGVGRVRGVVRARHRVGRPRARRAASAMSCWWSSPVSGCRSTSPSPSPNWASCGACGSSRRCASPGSRTTPPALERAGHGRSTGPAPRWHPIRARVVPLPRHRAPGARRRRHPAAGGRGRRHRRRERRRQDDARQAARPLLPADAGRIRSTASTWRRSRCGVAGATGGAFQDFVRFELLARETVGVGDEPRLDDEPAVAAAVGEPAPRSRRALPRDSRRSSARLGRGRRAVASGSGRSWPWDAG